MTSIPASAASHHGKRWTPPVMPRYCHIMQRQKRKQAKSREGMVITTVALPVEIHRRLLMAAVEVNAAATEVMRQAVSEWLAQHSRRKRGGSR